MKINKFSEVEKVAILPQYINSPYMFERFLDANNNNSEVIFRSRKESGVKFAGIDKIEMVNDNLEYFTNSENKKLFEKEFFNRLKERIGRKQTTKFCNIIKEYWYDGRTKRLESEEMQQLQRSIQNYFIFYGKVRRIENIRVISPISTNIPFSFNAEEINDILTLNRELVDFYMQQWLEGHTNYLDMGTGDIYLRRGIYLDEEPKELYLEWLYVNSYTLSFTVTEQFVQNKGTKIPIILNANYCDLNDRILFFSPFIKDMSPFQLELGIIPHNFNLRLDYQGEFGGIKEYLVG